MYIVKYAMWYITLVTAFTNSLLDATHLLHGELLQILLSFTLIFHLRSTMIGGNRGMLNLKKYVVSLLFNFRFMCVHSQPTKIMFVYTKYKNRKQIL